MDREVIDQTSFDNLIGGPIKPEGLTPADLSTLNLALFPANIGRPAKRKQQSSSAASGKEGTRSLAQMKPLEQEEIDSDLVRLRPKRVRRGD
jgi:hypothetical protein